MSSWVQESSPAQEFYDLSVLYTKKFGTRSDHGLWTAKLGRLTFDRIGASLLVQYLRPCATHFEIVWSNTTGFNAGDWHQHLEALRKVLILDRIADV